MNAISSVTRTVDDQERPTIEEQRAFYDERWAQKQYADRLQLERAIEILRGLRLVDRKAPRILELGCGTGWLTGILGRFGPAVGLELSPMAVEKARATFADVRIEAFDISNPVPLGAFDVVVSHEVIEHLDDQAGHVSLAARYLHRGGLLILTTPNGHPFLLGLRPIPGTDDRAQPIENWLSKRELIDLISREFELVVCRTILAVPRGGGVLSLLNGRYVTAVVRRLGLWRSHQAILRRLGFGMHLYVVARKRG